MKRIASRYPSSAAVGLLLALTSGGCDASSPPLQVQFGTINAQQNDYATFVDLKDGQQVELAGGPQGGFHVWTLYRVMGNTVARPIVVQRITSRLAADGSLQHLFTITDTQNLTADPVWELPAPQPSFICPTPTGVSALTAPVELQISLYPDKTDLSGQSGPPPPPLAQQQVRLQVSCPPPSDAAHQSCLSICQG